MRTLGCASRSVALRMKFRMRTLGCASRSVPLRMKFRMRPFGCPLALRYHYA